MATPEVPNITARPEVPTVSETLQQGGIQPAPVSVTQVNDNKGNPMMAIPATNSAKIQIPADRSTLMKKAKGSISDAATWLARFFLRVIAKQKNANNN